MKTIKTTTKKVIIKRILSLTLIASVTAITACAQMYPASKQVVQTNQIVTHPVTETDLSPPDTISSEDAISLFANDDNTPAITNVRDTSKHNTYRNKSQKCNIAKVNKHKHRHHANTNTKQNASNATNTKTHTKNNKNASANSTNIPDITHNSKLHTHHKKHKSNHISNDTCTQVSSDNGNNINGNNSNNSNNSTITKGFLTHSTFNFTYHGDIAGITNAFHSYDSSIAIYPSNGKIKYQNINIDLVDTNIASFINYVDNATNGKVKLEYYKKYNALRLIYSNDISVAKDALKQSQLWQDGETPSPVLSKDGIVLFPYGQYEPKITCQPLQLCDIQLQAGETVKGLMIGDSVRWNEGDGSVPVVYSGNDGKPIPHVVLKPTYAGLNTTLLVTTDKRTYYIKLFSADNANLSRVGFYYPSEQIQQQEDKRIAAKTHDDEILTDGAVPSIDPRNMHFNYKVSGDTDAAFNPVQVFDDGTHVYVQMSDSVRTNELPAFYVLGVDGKTLELVNFSYKKPFYIINKLFDKGVLMLGLDGEQQKITITKKS